MSQPTKDDQELYTIEQLADRWLGAQPKIFWNPTAGVIAAKAYEAGYLQGVSDALTGPQQEDDDE